VVELQHQAVAEVAGVQAQAGAVEQGAVQSIPEPSVHASGAGKKGGIVVVEAHLQVQAQECAESPDHIRVAHAEIVEGAGPAVAQGEGSLGGDVEAALGSSGGRFGQGFQGDGLLVQVDAGFRSCTEIIRIRI